MRNGLLGCVLFLALPSLGAERAFDFGLLSENQTPPGFRSSVTGQGKPGDWKIVLDEAPSSLPPLTPDAPAVTKRPVLAQLSQDPTDEHFPLLIFEEENFGDFTFTTRFKTVRGQRERMAGVAFRIQNETNYYVVRASSLGNTFRFYKVVNGLRGDIIGPDIPIPSGVWHELTIECNANQIRCRLNGQEVMPMLTDNSFASGKIGFWTKSDSVSYFADTKIIYTPKELPAQVLVRETLKRYPRLLGINIYVRGTNTATPRLVGARDETQIGGTGGKAEQDVIDRGSIYYGKGKDSVVVTMPLRDRNGDIIAAGRVSMKSFAGQTEANAVARATPIIKDMQRRIHTLQDLLE